ncbi:hypothetical protein ON010_g9772 [Phytophthora cinnamomi]|nr:hypothetical protein ON010_g9772 [Phytophthora cinnamomi]
MSVLHESTTKTSPSTASSTKDRTMEGVCLGDLHEEGEIPIGERARHVSDGDREDQLQHVVGAIGEVHSRLGLAAGELGLGQLQQLSTRSVYLNADACTDTRARTSFTSFRTRSAAKSERMYMPGAWGGGCSTSVTATGPGRSRDVSLPRRLLEALRSTRAQPSSGGRAGADVLVATSLASPVCAEVLQLSDKTPVALCYCVQHHTKRPEGRGRPRSAPFMPPNGGDAAPAAAARSRPLLHYKDLGLVPPGQDDLAAQQRPRGRHMPEHLPAAEAPRGGHHARRRVRHPAVGLPQDRREGRVLARLPRWFPRHLLPLGPTRHEALLGLQRRPRVPDRAARRHVGDLRQHGHGAAAEGGDGHCAGADVVATFLGLMQLDLAKSERSYILMVSSQLRVLLLNLTSGDGSAVQIGTKARQGAYGACFFTSLNVESIDPAKKREIRVFSSRPGRRVWVADPQSGTVSSTLKFSLSKNPSQFLQSPECAMEEGRGSSCLKSVGIQPRNLTINKLGRFQFLQDPPYAPQDVKDATTLLVSWNVGSSVLFFLDPFAVEIVEWHLDLGIIHDLKIYGADDMKKAVELAIEFNLNDALVVDSLQTQWLAYLEKIGGKSGEYEELTTALKTLAEKTKALEEEYRVAVESGLPTPTDSQPLQIIFKQRPQQAIGAASSDLFASQGDSTDTEVTLATGSTLHKPIEYFEVLAPSDQSYSKSICAPDGSFMDARLMDIPELPRATSVLPDDFRENYMEEVMEEVKRSEQIRNEEGAMNMNLLPALKDGSTAAAKAFSTFIPGSSMLTHLIDGSMITDPFGRSDASGIFSDFPEFDDDELVIDPDPRLFQRRYTHGQRFKTDTNECSVLRIAMSTIGEADESNLDTEVLMEAISMDIWDSNLKYTSNLPISEQLNLPESTVDAKENGNAYTERSTLATNQIRAKKDVTGGAPHDTKPALIESLKVHTSISTASSSEASTPVNKFRQRLVHRASMSPDTGRAAQRAIQKHFGATPSCEIKLKCMVGGRIAVSPELEPTIRRDVSELVSELQAASATAEKTKQLTQRLWPASGITRVCACLASLYLLQGDMGQVQTTITSWLNCFDPTAQHEEPEGNDESFENKNELTNSSTTIAGFARGEALVDGDGLPLTRGDWNLVRTLVSIYFAIRAAGSKLHLHPLNPEDHANGMLYRLYESEMGITLTLEPRYQWNDDGADSDIDSFTAAEAEAFVAKYGVYINPDLAAEVCNLRQFTGALKIVLDEVVSSADMEETYGDIVSWISEKKSDKAFAALKERDSLCLLLHLLDILLKKCPEETIEICVSKYPVLYPWNIEQALFGTELDWEAIDESADGIREILKPNTVDQTSKYFRYLVRLLEERGDEAGRDAQVVSRCLDLCFAGSAVVGDLFKEEKRSSRVAWVASLVRQPHRFMYDHDKCWAVFAKNNAFPALMELAMLSLQNEGDSAALDRGFNELSELVTLITKSEELFVFDTLFARVAVLPQNSENCLSKVLNQIQASVSIENRNEHLFSAVIHALLNSVNLTYGMRLLARFPLLFATTPLQTYHTIVETHVLTERQKHEILQILEIVDTNAWASYKEDVSATSSVSFAPQLAAILQLEMGTLYPAMTREQYEMWEVKCKQYDDETTAHRMSKVEDAGVDIGPLSKPTSPQRNKNTRGATSRMSMSAAPIACRSFEYRNSDWGGEVQLHDSTCGTCDLPVVIISDSKLVLCFDLGSKAVN